MRQHWSNFPLTLPHTSTQTRSPLLHSHFNTRMGGKYHLPHSQTTFGSWQAVCLLFSIVLHSWLSLSLIFSTTLYIYMCKHIHCLVLNYWVIKYHLSDFLQRNPHWEFQQDIQSCFQCIIHYGKLLNHLITFSLIYRSLILFPPQKRRCLEMQQHYKTT